MFEYCRGWKRKAGLVTLLLACAFAIGWVGSTGRQYQLDIHLSHIVPLRLLGMPHSVVVMFPDERDVGGKRFGIRWTVIDPRPIIVHQKSVSTRKPITEVKQQTQRGVWWQQSWQWKWLGITKFEVPYSKVFAISYPSIVVPLTLLSAWLLLSKPRTASKPSVPQRS